MTRKHSSCIKNFKDIYSIKHNSTRVKCTHFGDNMIYDVQLI